MVANKYSVNGLIRELKAAASKDRKGSKPQSERVESPPLCYSACGPRASSMGAGIPWEFISNAQDHLDLLSQSLNFNTTPR